MKRLMIRLLVGLAFALPLMLIAAAIAQASPLTAPCQDVTLPQSAHFTAAVRTAWHTDVQR